MKVPSAQEFADAADALNIRPILVVKDYFAVNLLLNSLSFDHGPYNLVFAGGTCLGKAHIDTNRMSEDIDIKLIPNREIKTQSRTQQKNMKRKYATQLRTHLIDDVFKEYDEPKFRNEYKNQTYYLQYPSVTKTQADSAIKPYLQLEITECDQYESPHNSSIISLYNSTLNLPPEIVDCECAGLNTIIIEKVVGLLRRTAEFERGLRENEDKFLVRHVYDLSLIEKSTLDFKKLNEILKKVVQNDLETFGHRHQEFVTNPIKELKHGLNLLNTEAKFKQYYQDFLEPLVYSENPATWETALTSVNSIFNKLINRE